jgi:hypothetical protein
MRNRTVAAVIALSCGAGITPIVASSASASQASATFCVKAKIGGKKVCLAQGAGCSRRYASAYQRYGFACVDVNGRYRLVSEQQ